MTPYKFYPTGTIWTVVHIAAKPEGDKQRCSRCGYVLIDASNCATIGTGASYIHGYAPGFVGVIEGNPRQSFAMDHDANAIDELNCRLVGACA
jgi:hypothetical protein